MVQTKTLGLNKDIDTTNQEFEEVGDLLDHEDTVMTVTYIKKDGITVKDKIEYINKTLKKTLIKQRKWERKEKEGKLVGWNNQGETATLIEED